MTLTGKFAPELKFNVEKLNHPEYKYRPILPINGTQDQPLTTTGGEQTQFELPGNSCYNLSKSYIEFNIELPAAAGAYNWMSVNGFPFWNRIQLQPRGGTYLADIYNLHNYLNMVMRQEFKLADMLTWDKTHDFNDAAGIYSGVYEGLTPTVTPLAAGTSNVKPTGASLSSPYEAMHMLVSAVNSTLTINVKLMLDKIPNSIFALDKILLFNENLYVNLYWNPVKPIGITSQSATDPTSTPGDLTGATVTGLALWLAADKNLATQTFIREKVATGTYSVLVPWVFQSITSISANSQQNPMLRLNGANGRPKKNLLVSLYCWRIL